MEKLDLSEITYLKEVISEGELPLAFDLLHKLLVERNVTNQNEYYSLKSRWSDLVKRINKDFITDSQARVSRNKIVDAFLSYLDQLVVQHGANLQLSAATRDKLPVLDESVQATLKFFLQCYQWDEQSERRLFSFDEVLSWFDFPAELEQVAHVYSEYLTDSLNSNGDAFQGVRPMLMEKIRKLIGRDELEKVEPKKLLDEAILSTIIKAPERDIYVNQVLDEYIPRLRASVTEYFDLSALIYNHLQRFNEAKVPVCIKRYNKKESDQAEFFSQVNKQLGQVELETIALIVERFNCEDGLRESLSGIVNQYVRVVNQELSAHYLAAENRRLRAENQRLLAEREQTVINQSDMYKLIVLSFVVTGLSIFVYHWIWGRDAAADRLELIERRVDTLQIHHDTLVKEVQHFDQQNREILDGLLELKK